MLALREPSAAPDPTDPLGGPGAERETLAESAILCATCGAVITSSRHRIVVNGSHEHRFMNPAGFLFHLGCFSGAIGCVVVGPASDEYPWFPGFSWRYALCGSCQQHLGWHFRATSAPGFFGLVLARLRAAT